MISHFFFSVFYTCFYWTEHENEVDEKCRYSLEAWKNQQSLDKEIESHKVKIPMKTYHPEKKPFGPICKDENTYNLLYNLSFSQSLETYWVWNEKAEMVRQVIMSLNVTPLRYRQCEVTDTTIKLNRVNVIELISMRI